MDTDADFFCGEGGGEISIRSSVVDILPVMLVLIGASSLFTCTCTCTCGRCMTQSGDASARTGGERASLRISK